jgi:hypothetical protein
MLYQLTYASRVAKALGPSDIKDIIQASKHNNHAKGITGILCLANGIFLQQLEGERRNINALYRHIQRDSRHQEADILDFAEIPYRRFGAWSMGLMTATTENEQLFLKYSSQASFDPYTMSASTLRAFFDEMVHNVRWITP